jgi:hypothetical protein
VLLFYSDDKDLYLVIAVMVGYSSTAGCILLVLCCLYVYQLYIMMFINISNICLLEYIVKISSSCTHTSENHIFFNSSLNAIELLLAFLKKGHTSVLC